MPLGSGRVLCAVLASPPRTSGIRTHNALARAVGLLACDEIHVVNLLDRPTSDTTEMAVAGSDAASWIDSRVKIAEGVQRGDVLLAAWGVSDLTGPAPVHRREQLRWGVRRTECRASAGLVGRPATSAPFPVAPVRRRPTWADST